MVLRFFLSYHTTYGYHDDTAFLLHVLCAALYMLHSFLCLTFYMLIPFVYLMFTFRIPCCYSMAIYYIY